MWILVWFESNLILEKDYGYSKEYFASLNGLFNATISYRNDSWIKNRFYAANRKQRDLEIYYKKSPNVLIADEQWKSYELRVAQKTK